MKTIKTIIQVLVIAIFLTSSISCNFGDYGVFAAILRDSDLAPSEFPSNITTLGFAQINYPPASDTAQPYAFASYGKLSKFDGSNWESLTLPSGNMTSRSIAAKDNSLFVITAREDNVGNTSLKNTLYVYEDRGDPAEWNPQWYVINLPDPVKNYPIMDKIFVLNERIFLVIRNTTNQESTTPSTKIVEISAWQGNTATIKVYVTILPPIRDASYALGKMWFLSTGSLYSLTDDSDTTIIQKEEVKINESIEKGPFYGLGTVTSGSEKVNLYLAAANEIYSYDGTIWETVRTLASTAFTDIAQVNSSLIIIATHSQMISSTISYPGTGLYQLKDGNLESPSEYDNLDKEDVSMLLTLQNNNVLIGTSSGSIWEFQSKDSSIERQ